MQCADLDALLLKAFSDGFTVENLSKATGVPIDLINRTDDHLTQEEIKELEILLCFLTQIYLEDVTDGKNLKNIVFALTFYFGLTYETIAHYLDLTADELQMFLEYPPKYNNAYNISLKLMNLFTSFVRDKTL